VKIEVAEKASISPSSHHLAIIAIQCAFRAGHYPSFQGLKLPIGRKLWVEWPKDWMVKHDWPPKELDGDD
jgi:hypothetical protein